MLYQIRENLLNNTDRTAFVINDKAYSYHELSLYITGIRNLLHKHINSSNKIVAVITGNNIETYAALFAIWFEGLTFLPLNPKFPVSRNLDIINQANPSIILYSDIQPHPIIKKAVKSILTLKNNLPSSAELNISPHNDEDTMYILFTSGSTGMPKGVPISYKNLNTFLTSFLKLDFRLDSTDRFLQMFDFTFDVSVFCYTIPLLIGATVYTVPQDGIKYLSVYKILANHRITMAAMVPSVIAFLKPYWEKINLPFLKYTILTGESVRPALAEAWTKCAPNSVIDDFYGPTEGTIFCHSYRWEKETGKIKSYNTAVTIGKPFESIKAIVVDEKNNILPAGIKGELLIAGNQVTKGYINNPEKNAASFITMESEGRKEHFYRTGDIVFIDEQGDYMYCGRIDNQVQVHGFRVELGEIEYQAGKLLEGGTCAAVARANESGNSEIYLFIEEHEDKISEITSCLQKSLPYYMQPLKIYSLKNFPFNANGKLDRNKLTEMIS
jgi:amino acid adenylation domain-containing protein